MVCALTVLVYAMPQEIEIDDSGESEIDSLSMPTESISSALTSTTTTSSPTTSTRWPTRSTTTPRPFQPLRPNRPLASMVHSTLQTMESVVVTAGILATTLLETLMPATSTTDIRKSYTSKEVPTNMQPSKYSALNIHENEIHYNVE